MPPRKSAISNVFAVLGNGVACFLLFLMLIPNIEAGRTEARLISAYNRVCEISRAHQETPSRELFVMHDIPELDPWGQPYRLVDIGGNRVRALSSGPNKKTPQVSVDQDDIYSDMTTPPFEPIRANKKKQLLIAIVVSAGAWLLFSIVFLRTRRETSCA
ncbi:hypothetical protein HG15A2_35510 [Adhaeretor mobilis]|uniref:Uncharacterized protein n=1 Tax=Adhaeretor mobilis TaxID=1930276 RepID=A0A517MZA0_9BACT|nr:hypothetical protein HG15A2_35510 [Adhaeretor mobilis]